MSLSAELQKAVRDALKADSALMALVNDVYDRVPADPFAAKTAYVSFGAEDSRDDDAEEISAREITLQIDVWSRAPGFVECKRITDLVRKHLHHGTLTLTDNAVCDTIVELTRVFRDADGLTSHGVVQVTALAEEP